MLDLGNVEMRIEAVDGLPESVETLIETWLGACGDV